MANIKLPERFQSKLVANQALDGVVKTTISTFGEILEDNDLFFFTEYTNHGITHIENVLASSDNLITDQTFDDILTDSDIGFYLLSVILHDIGMHLNLEGFKNLLAGQFDNVMIKELDKSTWVELWTDFLNEASKFSGKQLVAIFGNENTQIRIPPLDTPGKIDLDDRKLIGEFIRRHHPRLAHEMALKGFPGIPSWLPFAESLDKEKRNLIGLIARSHGMGLRKCNDYIETTYGKSSRRYPKSIHATYLMILLRIADYIQIDSSRTSTTLLKLKTFSSPISELEHNAHLAIDHIDLKYQDDPEKIFVVASPKDSVMFLKLNKLIKDIQFEFDMSWAVLGELYGTVQEKPSIKYRRITSNLEEEQFVSKQDYIADKFYFKSNDEIVKLLIAPLYGNEIKFGVRELLQNSIDACKERDGLQDGKMEDYVPLIKIDIAKDGEEAFFIITDNGVGMDVDVIKNYLLTAGASFRKSFEWKKEFIDEKGDVKIRRSGRFGIGILAAFLIGKEIYVETKKINSGEGFKFSADLNTEQINILKDEKISFGTSIKIKIDSDVLDKFKPLYHYYYSSSNLQWFEWYAFSKPKIRYSYLGAEVTSKEKLNPDLSDDLPMEWSAIDFIGFNKILWSYSNRFNNANYTCNGIIVPHEKYPQRDTLDLKLITKIPKISIFDNNGVLPLALNRNSFSNRLPFENEILKDIYKDFIAYFLSFTTISTIKNNKINLLNQRLKYPGNISPNRNEVEYMYGIDLYYDKPSDYLDRSERSDFFDNVLISKKGFIVDYNYFIQKLESVDAILVQSEIFSLAALSLDIGDNFFKFSMGKLNSIEDYKQAIEGRYTITGELKPINARIFMKTEKYNHIFKSDRKRVSGWLNYKAKMQFEKKGWSCLTLDEPRASNISAHFLGKYESDLNFIREYTITCPYEGDKLLNALLAKYIGDDVIIPFAVDERRAKYPLAFKELSSYMQKYISV